MFFQKYVDSPGMVGKTSEVAPHILDTLISAGVGLLTSSKSSGASKAAAQASAEAQKYAADLQKEMFDKALALQEPWRQAGYNALNQLNQYLGMGQLPSIDSFGSLNQAPTNQFNLSIDGLEIGEDGQVSIKKPEHPGPEYQWIKDATNANTGVTPTHDDYLAAVAKYEQDVKTWEAAGGKDGADVGAVAGSDAEPQAPGPYAYSSVTGEMGEAPQAGIPEVPLPESLQNIENALADYNSGPEYTYDPSQAPTSLSSGELLSQFQASPDYAFRQTEGINALDRSAAARGSLFSGRQGKAITDYASNLAAGEYGNWYGRRFNEDVRDYNRAWNDDQRRYGRLVDTYNRGYSSYGDYLNRLSSMAGVGQTAVTNQQSAAQNYANAGQVTANNLSNIYGAQGAAEAQKWQDFGGIAQGAIYDWRKNYQTGTVPAIDAGNNYAYTPYNPAPAAGVNPAVNPYANYNTIMEGVG